MSKHISSGGLTQGSCTLTTQRRPDNALARLENTGSHCGRAGPMPTARESEMRLRDAGTLCDSAHSGLEEWDQVTPTPPAYSNARILIVWIDYLNFVFPIQGTQLPHVIGWVLVCLLCGWNTPPPGEKDDKVTNARAVLGGEPR